MQAFKDALRTIFTLFAVILIAIYCYRQIFPTWSGFFYPHGELSNERLWRIKHGFKSLEDCRNWARAQMANTLEDGDVNDDDYECGKNCKKDSDVSISYLCEETLN